jgi:hypothetical protein
MLREEEIIRVDENLGNVDVRGKCLIFVRQFVSLSSRHPIMSSQHVSFLGIKSENRQVD